MEVNINLTGTFFCEQEQMSQIKFPKLLAKTLIYNNHYDEEMDEMPDKKHKSGGPVIVSSCSPYKVFWRMQIIATNSAYPQHKCMTYKKGYIPIVFVPQLSIGVPNALGITLPVLKTIFQHLAEFSWLKRGGGMVHMLYLFVHQNFV